LFILFFSDSDELFDVILLLFALFVFDLFWFDDDDDDYDEIRRREKVVLNLEFILWIRGIWHHDDEQREERRLINSNMVTT
jgi:hypothetical protein